MNELIKNTEEKMNKTVAVLERDYKSVRAGSWQLRDLRKS